MSPVRADAPLWLVLVVALIGYVIGATQHWVANRARKGVDANARRTEHGLRVRWAAEQALSSEPGKQRLGMAVLLQLEGDRSLDPADRAIARTAYRTILAPIRQAVDTAQVTGETVELELNDEVGSSDEGKVEGA